MTGQQQKESLRSQPTARKRKKGAQSVQLVVGVAVGGAGAAAVEVEVLVEVFWTRTAAATPAHLSAATSQPMK